MRRWIAVLALCGLLVLGGCAGTDLDPGDVPDGSELSPDDRDGADGPGSVPTNPGEGTIEVHSIDVGQGDATLIRTDSETMLIDSGDWRDDGETVIASLEALGVERIDHLVSSHAHAEHIGGHAAVIEHYETERDGVGAVYDSGVPHTSQTYEDYLDAVDRHDVALYEVAAGDEIPFEGVHAAVLNPADPGGDDLHDNSVVVHLQFGETGFLFTGDAPRAVERRLVDAHGDRLAADVYKAGHHGSDTSSGPALLDAVDPEVAVVSADYDSRYGHPHEEVLDRLAARDVAVTWTGVHGTTVFVSDGERVTVHTQHDATTDPHAVRSEDEATADPSDPVEERFVVGDGDDGGGGHTTDRLAPPAAIGRPTTVARAGVVPA